MIELKNIEAKKGFKLLKTISSIEETEEGLLQKKVEIVKALTDYSEHDIKAMKISEFLNLYNSLNIDEQLKTHGMPYKREVDGVKIKFVNDISQLCTGAYIDLQIYLSDERELFDKAIDICSCFALIYDEEQKKYVYKSNEGIKYVEKLPFIDLYNIYVFFYSLKEKLEQILWNYLKARKKKIIQDTMKATMV